MAARVDAEPAVRISDLPRLAIGAPFSFSGSVTLTPGGSLPVNEDALRNNTGTPLEVRELKFVYTLGAPASNFAVTIAVKRAKKVSARITQVPIPAGLLGIQRGINAERLINAGTSGGPFGHVALGSTVWRLDAPLYLLPGDGLLVTLSHQGFVPNSALVHVTMSGRTVRQAPTRRHLPYVTAYVGTQIDFSQTTTIAGQSSTEKHLVNALAMPVRITRFTGRLPGFRNGQFAEVGFNTAGDAAEQLIAITMRSSTGVPTVRFPTPFGRVFEQISDSFECQHTLPPKAYYIVNFTVTSPNTRAFQVLPMIAMHGVREDRS